MSCSIMPASYWLRLALELMTQGSWERLLRMKGRENFTFLRRECGPAGAVDILITCLSRPKIPMGLVPLQCHQETQEG